MSPLDLTVALLTETNPAVAAAVEAVGANSVGWPLPGWLGWLGHHDRIELIRACWLAHNRLGNEGFGDHDVDDEAQRLAYYGAWTHTQPGERMWHERVEPGVRAWLAHVFPDGDADEFLSLVATMAQTHHLLTNQGGTIG